MAQHKEILTPVDLVSKVFVETIVCKRSGKCHLHFYNDVDQFSRTLFPFPFLSYEACGDWV